jgi:hypothetical protein
VESAPPETAAKKTVASGHKPSPAATETSKASIFGYLGTSAAPKLLFSRSIRRCSFGSTRSSFCGARGSGFFRFGELHQGYHLIAAGNEPDPITQGQIPHMDGLVDPEAGHIHQDPFGKVLGQTFHFDIMQGRFKDAPIPYAYGAAGNLNRNPGTQDYIGLNLIKIHMQDTTAQDIPLGVLYKGFMDRSINLDFNDSTFGDPLDITDKLSGIQINGQSLTGMPVYNRRDTALPPNTPCLT